ncbi:MAG: hypothetical protein HY370_03055 [Proteobacteria bacterium]|nr:hypothetical protein [Pseudomonadota bacterium]
MDMDFMNGTGKPVFLCCRLSLERCGVYLSHLKAILHLLTPGTLPSETAVQAVISGLEHEISISESLLRQGCAESG